MKTTLSQYLIEQLLTEGGIAGHMAHPFDYSDFTGNDLIDLVQSLFTGKIERMKEKLDGTNINAYRNSIGEVRFIRNQADLNNPAGGMSVEEMALKWAKNPTVAENFVESGKTIEKILSKVPVEFFNPDPYTKVIVNCECISAGKTNVMVYIGNRVAFHGTSTYTKKGNRWVEESRIEGIPTEIENAAKGVVEADPRPDLILKSIEEGRKTSEKFSKEIEKLFKNEGLTTSATIDEWKKKRFRNTCPDWLDPDDVYRRWFYADKSVNLTDLKKKYSDHLMDLRRLDMKEHRDLVQEAMEPMDSVFGRIGNELIRNLTGFTNASISDEVVSILKNDLEQLKKDIYSSGTEDDIRKMEMQLGRLRSIGDTLNSTEGVVFEYKGRLMKLTGSFAALNQLMGLRKFSR